MCTNTQIKSKTYNHHNDTNETDIQTTGHDMVLYPWEKGLQN